MVYFYFAMYIYVITSSHICPSDSNKIYYGGSQQNLRLSSEQNKEYSKTADPHGYHYGYFFIKAYKTGFRKFGEKVN